MAFSLTSARRISPNANVSRHSKFSYRPTAHDHFLSTTTNLINLLWYKLSARQTYKTAKSIFNNRTFSFSFSPTVATPRTFFTALTGWTDFYPISDECTVKSPIEHKKAALPQGHHAAHLFLEAYCICDARARSFQSGSYM